MIVVVVVVVLIITTLALLPLLVLNEGCVCLCVCKQSLIFFGFIKVIDRWSISRFIHFFPDDDDEQGVIL